MLSIPTANAHCEYTWHPSKGIFLAFQYFQMRSRIYQKGRYVAGNSSYLLYVAFVLIIPFLCANYQGSAQYLTSCRLGYKVYWNREALGMYIPLEKYKWWIFLYLLHYKQSSNSCPYTALRCTYCIWTSFMQMKFHPTTSHGIGTSSDIAILMSIFDDLRPMGGCWHLWNPKFQLKWPW